MPATQLSTEAKDEIAAYYQTHDCTLQAMANRFGTTIWVVRYLLKQRNIPTHPCFPTTNLATRYQWTPEEEERVLQAWDEGFSVNRIRTETGIHTKVIRRFLEDHGITPVARQREPQRSPNWNGGKFVSHYGYMMVWVEREERHLLPTYWKKKRPGYYMLEHRLVMARHLGRSLEKWEHVHHINGERLDNRLENLQLRAQNHGSGQVAQCRHCGSQEIEWLEL